MENKFMKVNVTNSGVTYSWTDGQMTEASTHKVGTGISENGNVSARRMYLSFNMPTLPINPNIKKAVLKLFQLSGTTGSNPKIALYKVANVITSGECTPEIIGDMRDYDIARNSLRENESEISYDFDITKLIDEANKGHAGTVSFLVKMLNEDPPCHDEIVLCGASGNAEYVPQLAITYETNYGINTSHNSDTHEIGAFGQGSVDLVCGNLMLETEDFAWAGNRMPVMIKHLYNSALGAYQYTSNTAVQLNTADFSAMKIGNGFKLNVMQSMTSADFIYDGENVSGYVFIGDNGGETYFKESSEISCNESDGQYYKLYEDVNGEGMLYDPQKRTITSGDETYSFDEGGRLIKITDAYSNHMDITYTNGRITSVTDGAGRTFRLTYNENGFLMAIVAPDDTTVLYSYSGDFLHSVIYPEGKTAAFVYTNNKPSEIVLSENSAEVYKRQYAYSGDRVSSIIEYGVSDGEFVRGSSKSYIFSAVSRKTNVETGGPSTVYVFDSNGNVVSEYTYREDAANVIVNGREGNINNYLSDHSFKAVDNWLAVEANNENFSVSSYSNEDYAKFGKNLLCLQSKEADCVENGVYQETAALPAGNYTFSLYTRVIASFGEAAGVFLRVTDVTGNVLGESEALSKSESEYIRLTVPFRITSKQIVRVYILVGGKGTVYASAAQLENSAYLNAYNMLENSNSATSAGITGELDSLCRISQDAAVKSKASTRETFTLSGWAKGCGIAVRERAYAPAPLFRLCAEIKYKDTLETEIHTADFSPHTDDWQFTSVQFAKEKYLDVESLTVFCDYGYNYGTAYFGGLQLIRDSIETNLSADDFSMESPVVQAEESTVSEENEGETADVEETFEEGKDAYGNTLTETVFTDGEFGSIYRSFGYNTNNYTSGGNDAGNNLVRETDARGNETSYTVDRDTSQNTVITDRCGNVTAYEYDDLGRTAKVTSKTAGNAELANVSYAYDSFNNMTEIVRGDGMKYVLSYNAFRNLESIGVEGKENALVCYTYRDYNGRLKAVTYANGDTMNATYNNLGQLVTEKWTDKNGNLTAHYKYVLDSQENIVRSIDMLAEIEYNYTYEEGRLVRATESKITVTDGLVTSRNLENSIRYTYDREGRLTRKHTVFPDGNEQVIRYVNSEDGNTAVKFTAADRTVTSHSKTDSFGRKVFDEIQLGRTCISRQFDYHTGEVTAVHQDFENAKSSPTTQLVSRIVFSDGRTLSYEYDNEERITKITDSLSGTTEYTYDALGQLLTETVAKNGVTTVVNTMTYDNYGNILTKNGVEYTYGDAAWKDLLTAYNGQTITYDGQGNPVSYLGHTLTWEKGRQLKSFDNNTYTYNANGIRTSKTVSGVKHTYTLEGAKILSETWGTERLIPIYDNEDSVCGIIYGSAPYYFQKNLQGDVIGIVDRLGVSVAEYTYDAWGVCTVKRDITDSGIAQKNPFRYRGYYYDSETGLYYVSSRYYDPEIGRFISADEPMLLAFGGGKFGHNLFSYCENNPINQKDTNGYIAANIVGAAIGAIIGVVGGVFLGNWLADVLKLSGWKRGIFVAAVAALVGAAAGAIGYFIGPYVAKIATKLGHYVLDLLKKGKIAFRKLSNSVKSSIRALGKCACFVAGTLVLTEKGLVPIEEIVPGDKVWSENTSTGETGYKGVVKTFVNQVNTLVKLKFAEEEIKTTMNHPFWVVGSGWKSASKLQSGDKVKRDDGTMVDVLGVEIVYLDTPVNVYNFEVADWHTYFVGNTSILVHNMCAKEFVRSPKNAKQVLKYLKEQGFTVASQNGSHIKLTDGLKTVIVPDHGAKNIAIGTLRSIMKQAGLL